MDFAKRESLSKLGATFADSIEDLMSTVKFIVTSLPNDQVLNNVIFGDGGFIENAKDGQVLIELSTVLPDTIVTIANKLQAKNVSVLDSPISGGPREAEKGELTLIIAGNDDTKSLCKDILNKIGNKLLLVGEKVGEGKAVKLINNMMTMGNVLIASEAFAVGMKYGLDPQKLYDILSQTGGKSHHFIKRFPKVVAEDYSSLFSIELGQKDLDLALKWAGNQNLKLLVASFVEQNYQEAKDSGLANEDIVAIIKLCQQRLLI